MGSLLGRLRSVPMAFAVVFSRVSYRLLALALLLITLPMYLMILPSSFTGGAIGLVALPFLTLRLVLFAVAMSILLSLIVPTAIYAIRHGGRIRASSATGGVLMAVLTPLLCCSPAIPIAISAIAAVIPAAGHFGLPLQAFIATHESLLYSVSIGLLVLGLYGNARRVLVCSTLIGTQ